MILCYVLLLCVVSVRGQVDTRVSELEINSAVNSDNLIVISGLNVYRDELVVLDTFSGIITVRTESMSVEREYFDRLNITHVYSTVDDDTGIVALCTNKKGRCQHMNVTTLSVLGYGDDLILAGEQEDEVDVGVLVLIASTNTNIPSLFTASGNAATIGKSTCNPEYPIITAQLQSPLRETAHFFGHSTVSTFLRLFKAIFKSGGYVYIVIEDEGTNVRMTRICESDSLADTAFHSLYQTTITLCANHVIINVLDARLEVLTGGTEPNYVIITYESNDNVYVCAYSLSSINQAMSDTYQSCVVDGNGNIPQESLFSAPATSGCEEYNGGSSNTECDLWIQNQHLCQRIFLETVDVAGGILITTYPEYFTVITKSTSITDSGATYYYMYFAEGSNIDKFLLDGLNLTEPALERLTFSDRITNIQKDKSGNNIFAITNSRLIKIPVSDCERHASCIQCVSDRDPLCGWCSVQNTCNRRSLCINSNLTYRWIHDDATQCTSVNGVSPDTASINIYTNITILAYNLPELSEDEMYQCVFSNYVSDRRVNVTSVNGDTNNLRGPINGTSDIVCPVPNGFSPFTESDKRLYNISLSSSISDSSIASVLIQAFTIVDCSFNTDCTSCIDSDSPCGWCLYDSTCVPDVYTCYLAEWVEPTENPDKCPRVDSLLPTSSLIPARQRTSITLLGSNLPPAIAVYAYCCILKINNETIMVEGIWSNINETSSQIDCVISDETLLQEEGIFNVQLIWCQSNYSIRQGNISVIVFVCGNRVDCYNCLLNTNCNWCTSPDNRTGECSALCSSEMFSHTLQSACPYPTITNFTPVSTAVGGVLELQVNGYNLIVSDRETIVSLGDLNCLLFSQNSTVLNCYLETRETMMSSKINVIVDGISILTEEYFDTRIPAIKSISPLYAPQYGGSKITMCGENLLIGASRTVTAGKVCDILETWSNGTDDVITCVTQYDEISDSLMTISIDLKDHSYTQEPFLVLENPQVIGIYLAGHDTPLEVTSVSGGLDYELRGLNLGATVTQILEFFSQDEMISRSVCTPPNQANETSLFCPGEKFSESITVPLTGSAIRFELVMDSVPNVTAPFFKVSEFTIIPDPVIPARDENRSITVMEGDTRLYIEILNIDKYPSQAVAIVRRVADDILDETICSYLTYSSEGIVCQLNYTKTGQIELEIVIGLNANSYTIHRNVQILPVNRVAAFFMTNTIVIVVICILVIFGIVLVLSVVTLVCMWKYLGKTRTREYIRMSKYLKLEISGVEKEMVASYVKGFTHILDDPALENEMLFNETIPLLDFQTFAIRILFPNSQDHSVLHPLEIPHDHNSAIFTSALRKFESLLHDKQFVLAMVHAMEDNPNFNLQSRIDVASLLTISLFSSMPYLTEVLFDLLRELINRNVTRKQSNQLLERSESVAEALLTDWLAFNMYSDLRGSTSVAIYSLFLRMKGHFESAPIDVITGNANNSLSEEKFIRKEICYKVLCVDVETANGMRMPCKLLDCYTITQAKAKMMDHLYRGIGFSQRPKLEEVDVELRSAGKAKLLRDNDITNEEDEEWRRINTLSHYKVEDGMLLALAPRTQKLNPGQVWDCPGISICEFGIAKRGSHFGDESNKMYQFEKKESSSKKQNIRFGRSQYRSELFLPRLVATKRILQSSVDKLFEEIIPSIQPDSSDSDRNISIPKVIKILFDFFDLQAALYDIRDQEVVHSWKSNSLALRFWVKFLKNPGCLLDVAMGETQETALTVIAQAFIDGCSSGKSHATKESPTNKLLYNREVRLFKARVENYYEEVRNAPYADRDTLAIPTQEYLPQGGYTIFHTESAVYQLFNYAQSYRPEIWRRLCMHNMDRQRELFRQVCFDIGDNLYGGEDSD